MRVIEREIDRPKRDIVREGEREREKDSGGKDRQKFIGAREIERARGEL